MKSFLATSLRNLGRAWGVIYLANEEGGPEFTPEDEETLVMFASQAALVIANARRYREEQKARTDLETLIDTSPVGVAVFDARTGAPVSFNREMVRMMGALRTPDGPPDQLLEVLIVQRGDGRRVSLAEVPLAQTMISGETARAEEIVLSVPDGRSVSALMNATPILADDGEVETYVVTLQDMTALEELERLRAEFLAMVSHELRTPLTSVKGSITTLLDPPSPLNPAEMRQFHRIIDSQVDRMHVLISDLLDVARIETGTLAVLPRTDGRGPPGGRGPQRLPQRRGPARHRDRDCAGAGLGHGGPAAHGAGAGQPADQRRPALAGVVHHPGERRGGRGSTSRCRSRTGAGASPPRACRTCFASSPVSNPRNRGATPAWAWPSARG